MRRQTLRVTWPWRQATQKTCLTFPWERDARRVPRPVHRTTRRVDRLRTCNTNWRDQDRIAWFGRCSSTTGTRSFAASAQNKVHCERRGAAFVLTALTTDKRRVIRCILSWHSYTAGAQNVCLWCVQCAVSFFFTNVNSRWATRHVG